MGSFSWSIESSVFCTIVSCHNHFLMWCEYFRTWLGWWQLRCNIIRKQNSYHQQSVLWSETCMWCSHVSRSLDEHPQTVMCCAKLVHQQPIRIGVIVQFPAFDIGWMCQEHLYVSLCTAMLVCARGCTIVASYVSSLCSLFLSNLYTSTTSSGSLCGRSGMMFATFRYMLVWSSYTHFSCT